MGRLRLGALAALCLLPVAAAADNDFKVPAAAVQTLVALQERQIQNASVEFLAALQRKLRQRRPGNGAVAQLFDESMATPFQLPAYLAAFNAQIAVPRPTAWLRHLHAATAQWRRQYGATICQIDSDERSVLPATLPQALDEVRRLAALATQRQRQATDRRTRSRLAETYVPALAQLSAGFSTSLSAAERRRLRRFFARLHAANASEAVCAAEIWMQLLQPAWLARLRQLLTAHPNADAALLERVGTPYGEIVLGGRQGARWHLEDVLFVADLGGDDFYGIKENANFGGEPQLIVDFGGADRYQSARPAGYAAGVGRTALLVDMDGDDTYIGASHGQGSAVLGVGMLVDLAGDDVYRMQSFGQGAALFGVGLLLDENGSDEYHIRANGQGLGMAEGLGLLLEYRGADSYSAVGGPPTNYGTPGLTDVWAQGVARGVRGIAPGGIGAVVDYQGADRYDAGGFAQGGAYYWGVGQLVDLGSEDDDLLGSRYSAGWGAHGGIGYAFNEAGEDRYRTRHIVGAGIAWDYSMALFVDGGGNDFYRFGGLGLGAAAHHSASWFVDAGGVDRYADVGPLARADIETPNIALFADLSDAENTLNGELAPTFCQQRNGSLGIVLWSESDSTPPCDKATPPSP